jgi:putative serine protease PepD
VAAAQLPPKATAQGGIPSGLYVQTVTAGGPGAAAGLRVGDVIIKINGQPTTSPVQLQELTLSKKAGDTVDLEVWRGGQTASGTVTLGTQPYPAARTRRTRVPAAGEVS